MMTSLPVKVWKGILIFLFLFTILVLGLKWATPKQNESDIQKLSKLSTNHSNKKVILLMVDSLMVEAIDKGIKEKKLPTISFLIESGQYDKIVSPFPTMSVTIDSTLLTGSDPRKHQVPGLIWYSVQESRLVNYGTNILEIVENGVNYYIEDMLKLNEEHLNKEVTTIYEKLEKANYTTGSINGLIFRGNKSHQIYFPPWLSYPSSLPKKRTIYGPNFLSLGAFSNPLTNRYDTSDSITKKLGFNNKFAFSSLEKLIQKKHLPDFLYVYLPDFDQIAHEEGKIDLGSLESLDNQLHTLIEDLGGREEALKNTVIILMGDSGHTKIHPITKGPVIQLDELLGKFKPASLYNDERHDYDTISAVNERMAYIYLLKKLDSDKIITTLKEEKRIDQIAWRDGNLIYVAKGGTTKELAYRPGTMYKDPYDQAWWLKGDLDVLDIKIEKQGLTYNSYPNALQNIYAAMNSHQGDFIIITAKPGYTISAEDSPVHINGGAHGSLHKKDSLVPLIVAGTDKRPKHLRMEDLMEFILEVIEDKNK